MPKKGYDKVLDARDPRYDVVIVGNGELDARWHEEPGVHVLGPRSQEELVELYRAGDVFVLPAVGEMFTLVMQEAMATGLPVVTTDEPAYAGYGLDRRLIRLVEPAPAAIRAALADIVTDEGLRAEMGAYSRALACRWFDWEANVPRLHDLYQRVLGGEADAGSPPVPAPVPR